MLHFGLLLLTIFADQGYTADNKDNVKQKPLALKPENRYSSGLYDFNFLYPQQQAEQVSQFNFVDPTGAFAVPRYQPQFLYYGGVPEQPFLVNPGAPPNNFLYPQPGEPQGPGIIYRSGPQPGGPVFFGPGGTRGFTNQGPAFTPSIEKDAEEVPTNPSRIPPFNPKKSTGKPEKLETFNETPNATEADGLNETGKPQAQPSTPKINPVFTKPGHRYFVLNGQPLFSYPFSLYQSQNINPEDVLKYSQIFPQSNPQQIPVPVIPALRSPTFQNPQLQDPTFQSAVLQTNLQNKAPVDVKSEQTAVNSFPVYDPYYQDFQESFFQQNPNQIGAASFLNDNPLNYLQTRFFAGSPQQLSQKTSLSNGQEVPLSDQPQAESEVIKEKLSPFPQGYTKQNLANLQNVQSSTVAFRRGLPLSVIPNDGQNVKIRVSTKDFNLQPIPSKQTGYTQYTDDAENDSVIIDAKYDDDNKDSEAVSTPAKQPLEPSLAQAAPSAVALAGTGGVAEAGPRGTAFVGKEGMAVANPRATAIAGPAEEESEGEDQDSKKDTKKEKYIRQRFRGRYQ